MLKWLTEGWKGRDGEMQSASPWEVASCEGLPWTVTPEKGDEFCMRIEREIPRHLRPKGNEGRGKGPRLTALIVLSGWMNETSLRFIRP